MTSVPPPPQNPQAVPPQYPAQPAPPADYGMPGQPAWGYPAPPPKKKRRALKIALSCVAAFVVLVGGAIGWFVWDQASKMGKYKLVPPAAFDGQKLTTNNTVGNALASSSKTLSKAGETPVSAVYGTGDSLKYISFGMYGRLAVPSVQVELGFSGITGEGGKLSQKTDEDPGPLGGTMKCAVMTEQDAHIPLCVWADNSTMDVLMAMPADGTAAVSAADLAALADRTRQLRAAMEIKK